MDAAGGAPRVGTANDDDVVHVRAGNLVHDARAGALDGVAEGVKAVKTGSLVGDDLVGANKEDDIVGTEDAVHAGAGKIARDDLASLGDGARADDKVVGGDALVRKGSLLGRVSLGELLAVDVVPRGLDLEVLNKANLNLRGISKREKKGRKDEPARSSGQC